MINDRVNILLACFNGEKFIADQLDSITQQTHANWQLYIRDDGSSDRTIKIIQEYQQKNSRIHLLQDELGNLGSCQNFNALMKHVYTLNGYTMFSDQDDVWLPAKIEDTLHAMLCLEKKSTEKKALLVHTDFLFVDSLLKPIESTKNFQHTKITNSTFSNVICQNSAMGCTIMINEALKNLIDDIPAEAENHDYWIALVASAFGEILFLNKQTLLYRQHFGNLSPHYNFSSLPKRFKRIFVEKKNFDDVESKIKMATVFKKKYYAQISKHNKRVIDDFLALSKNKTLPLLLRNIKNGIRRQTINQTLLFYVTLFLSKKKRYN